MAPVTGALRAELEALRREFVGARALWVAGGRMQRLLQGLGASRPDLRALRRVSDSLRADPTLPFRRSKNGRFALDHAARRIRRLQPQPFILSAADDFVRHDSGQLRTFEDVDGPQWETWTSASVLTTGAIVQYNSVLHALFRFKTFMVGDVAVAPRPQLDYSSKTDVCTLFNLRTVTDASAGLLGQPALEGVHSDGVDFTMTTLLGHENMRREGSAATFLHTLDERNGVRWDEASPDFLLGQVQHWHYLDTLLIVDHERKHSLSPVWALDEKKPALRDMLIFFTRKPVVKGHVSFDFDSLKEHPELPLRFSMVDEQAVSAA